MQKSWGTNTELWERWQREADELDGERACSIDWWIPVFDIPCESPIERMLSAHLAGHAQRWGFQLIPQFQHGRYRYDFAVEKNGEIIAVVECDGREFHSTPEQLARDAAKDLFAKQSGFAVFRYSGHKIHRDPWKCAEEIIFNLWRSS